jgi:hypothetical protein
LHRSPAVLIAATALVLSGSACGKSATTATPHAPCVAPPEGIGPDAAGTLQNDDRGRSVCLAAGRELTVFLKAPTVDGARWSPIEVSDPTVLAPGNSGIMTLVRGVTGGIFVARGVGTARLASQLPACGSASPSAAPPTAACGAVESWSATVVVTAK